MTGTRIALGLGAAALIAVPVVVWAQSATQDVNLSANVTPFCKFNTVAIPGGLLSNFAIDSVSTSASALHIVNPINTTTGELNSASFELRLGSVCNTQSGVVLTTANGGLTPTSPRTIDPGSVSSFATRIDYTANAIWPNAAFGGGATLVTAGVPNGSASSGNAPNAQLSTLRVMVTIDASPTTIVAAGTYSDTLTVRLEPR